MHTISINAKFVLAAAFLAQLASAAPNGVLEARNNKATKTYGDYTGQKSQYPDGSGTYIRTEDVHRYASGHKCWTDYFAVTDKTRMKSDDQWERVGNEIHCGNESTCSMSQSKGNNKCSSSSLTITAQAGFSILKGIFDAGVTVTQEYTKSQCEAVSFTNTCTWSAVGTTKCRQVWGRTNYEVVPGYIRRRCNKKDGKGDQTVWSKDLDMTVPKNQSLNCDLECGDDANNPRPKTSPAKAPTSTEKATTSAASTTNRPTTSSTTGASTTKGAAAPTGRTSTKKGSTGKPKTPIGTKPATVRPTSAPTKPTTAPTTRATSISSMTTEKPTASATSTAPQPTDIPTDDSTGGVESPDSGNTDSDVDGDVDSTGGDDTTVGDDSTGGDNTTTGDDDVSADPES